MRLLSGLRLLLDVYGALFLLLLVFPPVIYGVLPYEGLLRLGSVLFYALCGVGFAAWLWLAARMGRARAPRDTGSPQ